jgi:hypothetical protein
MRTQNKHQVTATLFTSDPYGENCPNDDDEAEGSGEVKPCEKSEFGCCPDRESFARGPVGEGCQEAAFPTTTAAGLPERDIPVTIFDEEEDDAEEPFIEEETTTSSSLTTTTTAATFDEGSGEVDVIADRESGCAKSEYGCCLDGATAARGPLFEGCAETHYEETCADEPYGCCPDGVTSALGPEFAGCGHRLQNAGEVTRRESDSRAGESRPVER